MRRLSTILLTAATAVLVLAPSAFAIDSGQGAYGPAGDKIVTNAGFILIIFFPAFILLATLLQSHLEKRKDARKKAAKARSKSKVWSGGW